MNESLIEGATVTLAEIAKVTKMRAAEVEAEALALDLFVGINWAGLPAVSVADAYGLASGRARLAYDGRQASLAHMARLEQWEQGRESARAVGAKVVYEEHLARGEGAPAAAHYGNIAGDEAAAKYEHENPPPQFGEAVPESTFGRVVARVKAAVR
jgi:hypothetical protein